MDKLQNVVFFIGAGFSAPFGLPVMSNFIDKANDLYFSDIKKYAQIGKTLALIEKYSKVKNYLNINLHNIEDLLSISYMESSIKRKTALIKNINEFIKTIIESYTVDTRQEMIWFSNFVSNKKLKKGNVFFASDNYPNRKDIYELLPNGKEFPNSNYGIISLNYDLLIENALSKIAEQNGEYFRQTNSPNSLKKYYRITKNDSEDGILMAKLHGSIDSYIVPPTWNKNINHYIQADWILANKLLSNATHIIFLGYSLPQTDNYIRFLLASSLNNNNRLKRIIVVNIDNNEETKNRYKSLFSLEPKYHNANTIQFLRYINIIAQNNIDFDNFDNAFYEYYKLNK